MSNEAWQASAEFEAGSNTKPLDHLAEVDGEIMIELLDVVMARYNRSHRTARAYHLALMELAGRLPPVRLAA